MNDYLEGFSHKEHYKGIFEAVAARLSVEYVFEKYGFDLPGQKRIDRIFHRAGHFAHVLSRYSLAVDDGEVFREKLSWDGLYEYFKRKHPEIRMPAGEEYRSLLKKAAKEAGKRAGFEAYQIQSELNEIDRMDFQ